MRQLYIAAYDITEPRRQSTALGLVRGFASGGQKSVHECFFSASERNDLFNAMDLSLQLPADRFLMVRLDPSARTFTLGIAAVPVPPKVFYFG
jgi:CRISPR-associated protein Cas2